LLKRSKLSIQPCITEVSVNICTVVQLTTCMHLQIDAGMASWRDCMSVKPLTATTGQGLQEILQHVTELIPKWSTFIPPYRLSAWRYKMALALAGAHSRA
jgi:hypothetical protein